MKKRLFSSFLFLVIAFASLTIIYGTGVIVDYISETKIKFKYDEPKLFYPFDIPLPLKADSLTKINSSFDSVRSVELAKTKSMFDVIRQYEFNPIYFVMGLLIYVVILVVGWALWVWIKWIRTGKNLIFGS